MDKDRIWFALVLMANVFMMGIMVSYETLGIDYKRGYWFLFGFLALWGFIGVIVKKSSGR